MKGIRAAIPILVLAVMAGGTRVARAQEPTLTLGRAQSGGAQPGATQNGSQAAKKTPAPDPETVTVGLANRVPLEDRANLKVYWPGVRSRTRDAWVQLLPAPADAPDSMFGQVKIIGWLRTDGTMTNMVMEQSSGQAALDRAALAAIAQSSPYGAFPYGLSVDQVRVRFTFTYKQGPCGNVPPGSQPVPARPLK